MIHDGPKTTLPEQEEPRKPPATPPKRGKTMKRVLLTTLCLLVAAAFAVTSADARTPVIIKYLLIPPGATCPPGYVCIVVQAGVQDGPDTFPTVFGNGPYVPSWQHPTIEWYVMDEEGNIRRHIPRRERVWRGSTLTDDSDPWRKTIVDTCATCVGIDDDDDYFAYPIPPTTEVATCADEVCTEHCRSTSDECGAFAKKTCEDNHPLPHGSPWAKLRQVKVFRAGVECVVACPTANGDIQEYECLTQKEIDARKKKRTGPVTLPPE